MRLPGYNSLKNSHRLLAVLSAPSISETSLLSSSFQLQIPHPSGSLMSVWHKDKCPYTRERETKPMKWNCLMKICCESLFGEIFLFHRELKCICCTFFSVNNVYCLDYIFCETLHGPLLARDELASVGLQFSSRRVVTHKEERKPTTA